MGDVIVFHMHSSSESLYGEITDLHRHDQYILIHHDYADLYIEPHEITCNVTQAIEQLTGI